MADNDNIEKTQQDQPDQAGSEQAQQAEDLLAKIEALQKERDELFARLQRVSADYTNFQRRLPRQMAENLACEQDRMLKALLPICDHLEMAIEQATLRSDPKAIVEGIRIVYDQLQAFLRSYGVEPIQPVDQAFDPRLHEALMTRCEPAKTNQVVLQECQKGYMRGERVLRPSKVIVNALGQQAQSDNPAQSQADGQAQEDADKKE
ncbi:MAG: nucleotide exchange factor GrpE [Sedimentisphaerales bacterium]|jgi:molecular chaperone GrpE|nr:nucleotide exchange factor GrpE [Sedimentisphaerales bacterium]